MSITRKRDLCPRCARPVSVCFCQALQSQKAPFRIALLQPAREKKHALNTGRIVNIAVSNCDVFEGEDFSGHPSFQALLAAYRGRAWLLYPGDNARSPSALVRQETEQGDSEEPLLIVLDATWRKSRKMLYLFPELASLPRTALPEEMVSNYRLRKVPGDGYLSTVEAVVAVLAETGHAPDACRQMLDAFDKMINAQISAMGGHVWRANYVQTAS